MLVPALIVGGVAWLAGRAVLMVVRKPRLQQYWQQEMQRQPGANAVRLVVFGDSLSQGVGASRPQNSFVAKMADYIATQTGRRVHVANYSQSGAVTGDVLQRQLPQANLKQADIILLEIGTNDSNRLWRDDQQFIANVTQLIEKLPAEKTVIADLPYPQFRRGYQPIVARLLANQKVARVYPSRMFDKFFHQIHLTAGDFWHPNDKGYKLWFEIFRPGVDEVLKRRHLLKSKSK